MALSQRRARLCARLRSRKTREREGLVLVEGVRAAREALAAGASIRFAVLSPRLRGTPAGVDLHARLSSLRVEIEHVDDAELASLSDTEQPQGVLAVCVEPPSDLEDVRAGGRYLTLDAVQDPGNLGTLVRAAVAFGMTGVLVLDGCVDPWSPKTVRASAGMMFRLPVIRTDGDSALAQIRYADLTVLIADGSGVPVARAEATGGFALVVGNEGGGVRSALRHSGNSVAVPMPGSAESLNVGVAGSILMYELTKRG